MQIYIIFFNLFTIERIKIINYPILETIPLIDTGEKMSM
jgi:hypothetical protein